MVLCAAVAGFVRGSGCGSVVVLIVILVGGGRVGGVGGCSWSREGGWGGGDCVTVPPALLWLRASPTPHSSPTGR